jgi:hypothetical protein
MLLPTDLYKSVLLRVVLEQKIKLIPLLIDVSEVSHSTMPVHDTKLGKLTLDLTQDSL